MNSREKLRQILIKEGALPYVDAYDLEYGIDGLTFPQQSLFFGELSSAVYYDAPIAFTAVEYMGCGSASIKGHKFYDSTTLNTGTKGVDAQAMLIFTDNDIILVCRGTSSLTDVKTDLNISKACTSTNNVLPYRAPGYAHAGFLEYAEFLYPFIKADLLAAYMNDGWKPGAAAKRQLWITGHSLGAGSAVILAGAIDHDPALPKVNGIFTYGCPRPACKSLLRQINIVHHRWRNNNDIVTTVPPRMFGYRHQGTLLYFNSYGNVRKAPNFLFLAASKFLGCIRGCALKNAFDKLTDHLMKTYLRYLRNFANRVETPEGDLSIADTSSKFSDVISSTLEQLTLVREEAEAKERAKQRSRWSRGKAAKAYVESPATVRPVDDDGTRITH